MFPPVAASELTKSKLLDYSDNQSRFANMMVDLNGSILSENRYLLIRVFINGTPETIDQVRAEANEKLFH